MKPPTCTYDAVLGWLTPEHRADCDQDCPGCRPCPKSHCDLLGRCANHVEQGAGIFTCPGCIGRVRRDLIAIVNLYALVPFAVELRGMDDDSPLLEEAADSGIESEAFNLIGPAATHEQWSERRARLTATYQRQGWCQWPRHEGTAADDPHHPYAVLGRWDLAMRESYGPQTDLFVTVTSSADYLTKLLDGPFAHVAEFVDFAREIRTCRDHLEQTTHDARAPEEGRPCPRCAEAFEGEDRKGPQLRKLYAPHPKLKAGEQCPLPPRSEECRDGCRTCAGDDDTWHCPGDPAHWWTEHDYRSRVATDYVGHAPLLTMRDLPERTGIAAGTLRRWAGRTRIGTINGESVYGEPKLKARGRNAGGRKVYRVEEVLALRVSLDIKTLDVSKSG